MRIFNRKNYLTAIVPILLIFLSAPFAFAGSQANATIDSVQSSVSTYSESSRPFGVPGGLILPGFPTNVDTNGGDGAMYFSTKGQLQFKNIWTEEELSAGNQKWIGNKVSVSMYVHEMPRGSRPAEVALDYIHQVKTDAGVQYRIPMDLEKYEYQFVGYIFVRALSMDIMAPENTIDAARMMRMYGADFGLVLNDGVEKTMVASSKGLSIGGSVFGINENEKLSGVAVGGIGIAKGTAGMKGFPWVQFACYKRVLRDKSALNKPTVKTNVTNYAGAPKKTITPAATVVQPKVEAVQTPMKPIESAPKTEIKVKSNIKGYTHDFK